MKVQVIIPAGGRGTRFGSPLPKLLVSLKDKPMIVYGLEVLQQCAFIDSAILVVPADYLEEYKNIVRIFCLTKVKKVISGGETRRDSVLQGIQTLDEDTDFVIVHDGARIFVTPQIISEALRVAKEKKAVIVAVPIKSTIKRASPDDLCVKETIDRRALWEVQTPQVFAKEVLLKAHQANKDIDATDDSILVEQIGEKVYLVAGSERNIKITTKEDMIIAQEFLKLNEENL